MLHNKQGDVEKYWYLGIQVLYIHRGHMNFVKAVNDDIDASI